MDTSNTDTPQAAAALDVIMRNRQMSATDLARDSQVGDVSSISRDVGKKRSITPRRLRAYLSALPKSDALTLAAAYVGDCLGDHTKILLDTTQKIPVLREDAAPYMADKVPATARQALAILADAAKDLEIADWLARTAAIMAPRAVHEATKKQDKRRKNDYG